MPQVSARAKILSAGFEVMYRQGFNGCSIQDITDAAGVPKGSFYNHFKGKEDFAVAVVRRYAEDLHLDRLVAPSADALKRLRAHFKALSAQAKSTGFARGCLSGNLASEMSDSSELLRVELANHFRAWRSAIATVLVQGQASGHVIVTREADQLAGFVLALWEGAALSARLQRSMRPMDDFFKLAFRLVEAPAERN